MCREDKDGDLETIWREVELQLQNYIERENNHMVSNSEKTELVTEEEVPTANIVLRKRKKRSIFLRVGSWQVRSRRRRQLSKKARETSLKRRHFPLRLFMKRRRRISK
mmetsp:Transcript_4581/g.8921  ORF Transcript_4581/g.8921 Transcript_4581/m.8921 type:complete len:108 (+) Transcript_4581:1618-1941(+)